MLHAECLTVDPDHFNRNTEALPQAHRKSLCHMDIRSLHDQWLRFQASAPAIWTPEALATCRKPCFCALRTLPIQGLLLDRGRVQDLWGLPNISACLRATCAALPPISAAGCRGTILHATRATCQRPLARSPSGCCQRPAGTPM